MQKVDPGTPAKPTVMKEEVVTPSTTGPAQAINNGNSNEQSSTPTNAPNNSFRGKRGGRGGRGGPMGMGRGANHQGGGGRGGRGGAQNGNNNRFPPKNNGPNQERKWDGDNSHNSHNNFNNGGPKQSEVLPLLHAAKLE